ncbi:hypothetical protein MNBD_ALPHA06-1316, partial [hydrothermal vent metagenome]
MKQRDAKQIATELLVLQVQSADRKAFEQLYRQWTPILL